MTPYLWLFLFCLLHLVLAQAFIYAFQIKEYRFDRFSSQLMEEGIGFLTKNIGRRGAFSLRNILISIVSLLSYLAVLFLSYIGLIWWLYTTTYVTQNTALLPILSYAETVVAALFVVFLGTFISVVGGVLFTRPLSWYVRKRAIQKARLVLSQHKSVQSIVISGSYGKSSVKEMLYHIASSKFTVAKTERNMNTDVGVALSITKNLTHETQYFIGEVGGYRRGEVARATEVFANTLESGIITSFGNQHVSLYGSRDNLIRAESEIIPLLTKPGATVYINQDAYREPIFQQEILPHATCRFVTYSASAAADIVASDIHLSPDGAQAHVTYGNFSLNIKTQLLGRHSVENLLPVIGWCVDHHYTKAEIEHAITTFTRIEKKLTVSRGVGGSIVLDDTGNSSGNGFFAALDVLSLFAKKNKIVIGGGIIELGSEKNSTYQELMTRLNDVSTAYITTDRLFKKYDTNSLVRVFTKEQDVMQYLATFDLKNTIILLEGRQPKKRLESIIMGE